MMGLLSRLFSRPVKIDLVRRALAQRKPTKKSVAAYIELHTRMAAEQEKGKVKKKWKF